VLELAVKEYGAQRGSLLGVRDGSLRVLARLGAAEPSEALVEAVERRLMQSADDRQTVSFRTADANALDAYTAVVLCITRSDGSRRRVGALLLSPGGISVSPGVEDFVQRLAEALYESGDVSAIRA
jgi:hypothetical protein